MGFWGAGEKSRTTEGAGAAQPSEAPRRDKRSPTRVAPFKQGAPKRETDGALPRGPRARRRTKEGVLLRSSRRAEGESEGEDSDRTGYGSLGSVSG